MLKSIKRLLLIAALLVPWVTNAQTTVTVADGTATNSYIPIYGLYADEDQHNQFIYPASMLSDLSGGMITGMTFFAGLQRVGRHSHHFDYGGEWHHSLKYSADNGSHRSVDRHRERQHQHVGRHPHHTLYLWWRQPAD